MSFVFIPLFLSIKPKNLKYWKFLWGLNCIFISENIFEIQWIYYSRNNSIDTIAIKHGMWPYLHGFYTHLISKNPHKTKKFMESYLDDDQIKELTYKLTGKKI